MLQQELVCDECGRPGQDPVADICGDWLGTPENGYPCPDIICLECRIEEEGGWEKLEKELQGVD